MNTTHAADRGPIRRRALEVEATRRRLKDAQAVRQAERMLEFGRQKVDGLRKSLEVLVRSIKLHEYLADRRLPPAEHWEPVNPPVEDAYEEFLEGHFENSEDRYYRVLGMIESWITRSLPLRVMSLDLKAIRDLADNLERAEKLGAHYCRRLRRLHLTLERQARQARQARQEVKKKPIVTQFRDGTIFDELYRRLDAGEFDEPPFFGLLEEPPYGLLDEEIPQGRKRYRRERIRGYCDPDPRRRDGHRHGRTPVDPNRRERLAAERYRGRVLTYGT